MYGRVQKYAVCVHLRLKMAMKENRTGAVLTYEDDDKRVRKAN